MLGSLSRLRGRERVGAKRSAEKPSPTDQSNHKKTRSTLGASRFSIHLFLQLRFADISNWAAVAGHFRADKSGDVRHNGRGRIPILR